MPKFLNLFFIIFLLVHFTRSAPSLASVIITETSHNQAINQNITHLVEFAESPPGFALEKEDLKDTDILNFKPFQKPFMNLTYSKKTRWVRFHFENQTNDEVIKDLVFNTPLNGSIYVIDDQARVLETMGSSIPNKSYFQKSNLPSYRLQLSPGENRVLYWAIRSRHNASGEIILSDAVHTLSHPQDLVILFYAGGILALLFFNLLTYIFTREEFYKYYLFYVSSFLFFVLCIKGKFDQWFYFPNFTVTHYLICFSSILAISSVTFTRNFLKFPFANSLHQYLHYGFLSFFGLLCILGLTPIYDYLNPLLGHGIDFGIIIACFYMIYMGVKTYKINKIFSTIYLLSWSFIFIGVFSWFGMKWGYIPGNMITQNILLIANLLEMTTLSLGISIRQLEWQKEKSLISQKAAEKEKFERLLKVLTHDLSNPLTLVLANTKRLMARDELTYQNQSLEKILLATENMKKVLTKVREEQLLNFSPESPGKVNILEALQYSMIFFEDQLQNKHIKIELNLNSDLTLNVDRTVLINNIFNNILSNAIKFSHQKGLIKISSFSTNHEIIVEFRDFGVGMSPELLNSFYDNSTIQSTLGTAEEAGSGFGLRLVQEYMRKFGGNVEISSKQIMQDQNDQGTTVRLIFPLDKKSL